MLLVEVQHGYQVYLGKVIMLQDSKRSGQGDVVTVDMVSVSGDEGYAIRMVERSDPEQSFSDDYQLMLCVY